MNKTAPQQDILISRFWLMRGITSTNTRDRRTVPLYSASGNPRQKISLLKNIRKNGGGIICDRLTIPLYSASGSHRQKISLLKNIRKNGGGVNSANTRDRRTVPLYSASGSPRQKISLLKNIRKNGGRERCYHCLSP
jgi:hypothetical protein